MADAQPFIGRRVSHVLLASKFLATQKHADEGKQVEVLATVYATEIREAQ